MPPLKMKGYIQTASTGRRNRSEPPRPPANIFETPQSGFTTPRPGIHVFPSPESGVSTRYHSAESLLAGGTPERYMTPATIDTIHKPDAGQVDEEKNGEEEEEEASWPDVLVVTGLEDCESPLQIKLIDLVKLSKIDKGEEMLVVWVRNEGKSDVAPAWLVRSRLKMRKEEADE